MLLIRCAAVASTTAPSGAPVSLGGGAVHFVPPAGWTADPRGETEIRFRSPQKDSSLTVSLLVQQTALPDSPAFRQSIGQKLAASIRKTLLDGGHKLILEPTMEPDARFFLRIRDVVGPSPDKPQTEHLYLYRSMGRNLVSVSISAAAGEAQRVKAAQKAGEDLLLGVKGGRGPAGPVGPATAPRPPMGRLATTPTAFSRAGVSFPLPADWQQQRQDQPSGAILTCRDARGSGRMVLVLVRPLPADARQDPALRKRVVDEIIAGQKAALELPGVQPEGQPQVIRDARFLRKSRQLYRGENGEFHVEARHVLVGDTVLSITSVAPSEDAAAVGEMADRMALAAAKL